MDADAANTRERAQAVRNVLDDPVLRERLIRGGQKLTSRYPADKMIDAYKDLLEICR